MRNAINDIAALKEGSITPKDVDPRAAARWIQILGLETLRILLGLPDDGDPTDDENPTERE
jgi:hypothetical protein